MTPAPSSTLPSGCLSPLPRPLFPVLQKPAHPTQSASSEGWNLFCLSLSPQARRRRPAIQHSVNTGSAGREGGRNACVSRGPHPPRGVSALRTSGSPGLRAPRPAEAPKGKARGPQRRKTRRVLWAVGQCPGGLGVSPGDSTPSLGHTPTHRPLILGVPPQKSKCVPRHPGGALFPGGSCPVLVTFHLSVPRGRHLGARWTEPRCPPHTHKTGTAASKCDGVAAAIAAAAIWGLCPQQAPQRSCEAQSGVEAGGRQGTAAAAAISTQAGPEPRGAGLVSAGRHRSPASTRRRGPNGLRGQTRHLRDETHQVLRSGAGEGGGSQAHAKERGEEGCPSTLHTHPAVPWPRTSRARSSHREHAQAARRGCDCSAGTDGGRGGWPRP